MRSAISIAFLAIICSIASASQSIVSRPSFDKVLVTSRGQEAAGDFCEDFALTSGQASAFLKRSATITPSQVHDDYDTLPCWVRGTAHSANGLWNWEIRAGGTARIESPAGDVELRGCKTCSDLLGGVSPRSKP
jgi:hypothetical protein